MTIKDIRRILKITGWTVAESARRMGYSDNHVRKVLDGTEEISQAMEERLTKALDELKKNLSKV